MRFMVAFIMETRSIPEKVSQSVNAVLPSLVAMLEKCDRDIITDWAEAIVMLMAYIHDREIFLTVDLCRICQEKRPLIFNQIGFSESQSERLWSCAQATLLGGFDDEQQVRYWQTPGGPENWKMSEKAAGEQLARDLWRQLNG